MNIKNCRDSILNSSIVSDAKSKIAPTMEALKGGGYKVLIISLILVSIFLPLNAFLVFLSKILIGAPMGIYTLEAALTGLMSGYSYMGGTTLVMMILIGVAALIVGLVGFIVGAFIVPNGAYRSFRIFVAERRVVSVGEFFGLSFTNLISFSWGIFVHVFLPIWTIEIIGSIMNFIPFIKGNSIAGFVVSISYYAFIFRYIAKLMEVNYEEVVIEYSAHWLTYAVIVYIIQIATSLSLVTMALNIVFILFTVILLVENKTVEIDDQFYIEM